MATGYTNSTKNKKIKEDIKALHDIATTTKDGLMSSSDKKKLDGVATNANNYSHPTTSGNKHIPSGGSSGQVLRWSADGTAVWGDDNNTTYSVATTSSDGLMSSKDKYKLDTVAYNANNYSHPSYSALTGNPTSNQSPSFGDQFTITQPVCDDTGHITKMNSRTITLPKTTATGSVAGLMSATDKYKLDNIASNANNYSLPIASSSTLGGVKTGSNISNSNGTISLTKANVTNALGYTPSYSGSNIFTDSSTNTVYGSYVTNGNVHLNHIESGTVRSSQNIKGTGGTTVTTNNYGNLVIDSPSVTNSLTSTSTTNALSAYQGKLLNENKSDKNHVHLHYALNSIYGEGFISNGRVDDTTVGTKSIAYGNQCAATGSYSQAMGKTTTASNSYAHAEGWGTIASGQSAHAEGTSTQAKGDHSHAGGRGSIANGTMSHAEGCYAYANDYMFAIGHWNNQSLSGSNYEGTTGGTIFVIGNGTSASNGQGNAFRVTDRGQVYSASATMSTGADYAEYFEWVDENPNKEDRAGYFVTFDDNNDEKIRFANKDDYILGIVSGSPSVVGNSDECWKGRYILDNFGRYIEESFEYEEPVIDKETGEETKVKKTGTKWKENPDYDSTKSYISRDLRPEWDAVGMLGVLSVYDDGTCKVNGYCKCADGGIATASETGYRVIKRVTDNIVKVVLK